MRLEGQAKGGYFPTPKSVTKLLVEWLDVARHTRGTLRLIDPCAGKGTALADLAMHIDPRTDCRVETYGVEENEKRSKQATGALDRHLNADYFSAEITDEAFSLLLLNPPYDHSIDRGRMEIKFLRQATKLLAKNNGILLFIIPEPTIKLHLSFLAANYEDIQIRRFPEDEYPRFRQVVIMGRRKWREEPDQFGANRIASALSRETIPWLDDPHKYRRLYVPVPSMMPSSIVEFSTTVFNPLNAMAEVANSDPFAQDEIANLILPPPGTNRTRPLTPLRRGHLAMLLAAGCLNNLVLEQEDDDRVLIKGQAFKRDATTEATKHKTVETEQLHITIEMLNLKTGVFRTVST